MPEIDFTHMPQRNKAYAGANGSKISVIYQGEQYMLKFSPLPTKNKDMSYFKPAGSIDPTGFISSKVRL
ncbi:MAG: hypothetical protein ACLS8T_35150 [Anaerobutyricum sp.]